jgi:nucleotide-binding universal stress UspA family protein
MYQRILVPVDGSSASTRGLAEAVALARLTGGRIHLLHVMGEPFEAIGIEGAVCGGAQIPELVRADAERLLAAAAGRVEEQGVAVDWQLMGLSGARVCDLVLEVAREWPAELIVIGTHGRRGIGRMLLGSEAEQILRNSPVPVLLVHGARSDP